MFDDTGDTGHTRVAPEELAHALATLEASGTAFLADYGDDWIMFQYAYVRPHQAGEDMPPFAAEIFAAAQSLCGNAEHNGVPLIDAISLHAPDEDVATWSLTVPTKYAAAIIYGLPEGLARYEMSPSIGDDETDIELHPPTAAIMRARMELIQADAWLENLPNLIAEDERLDQAAMRAAEHNETLRPAIDVWIALYQAGDIDLIEFTREVSMYVNENADFGPCICGMCDTDTDTGKGDTDDQS